MGEDIAQVGVIIVKSPSQYLVAQIVFSRRQQSFRIRPATILNFPNQELEKLELPLALEGCSYAHHAYATTSR